MSNYSDSRTHNHPELILKCHPEPACRQAGLIQDPIKETEGDAEINSA